MIDDHDYHMSVIIRTFAEYEEGFTVGEESWLGLKQLAELTKVVVTNVFFSIQFSSMILNLGRRMGAQG